MLIDWFTVGAQALNFLILVWLMKRYLYKPILHAIDDREQRIAAELADAAAKKSEAQKQHGEFLQKNQAFEEQRATLVSKATAEVNAQREKMIEDAKSRRRIGGKAPVVADRRRAKPEPRIIGRTQLEVFAIARKALVELAAASLEERMVDVFNRRLRAMDGDAHTRLAGALRDNSAPPIIRSAFALPEVQCASVRNAINETFSADVPLRFEISPDLVCGIELTAGGQKVAWTIEAYLQSLRKGVDELIDSSSQPVASDGNQPKPKQTPKAA